MSRAGEPRDEEGSRRYICAGPIGFPGDWRPCNAPKNVIAAAYDATAIPATFLIGPDGKILAKDLRGEKVKTTVAEALKRYKTAEQD
jgi:hypothetical protein